LVFELQSRCAFRAQAQLRLHAEAIPTVSLAIEPAERGVLMHRVLGELWQELKSWEGLRAALGESSLDLDAPSLALPRGTGEGIDNKTKLAQHIHTIVERVAQQVLPATTTHRQRLVALEVELATQSIMALLQVELQRSPFIVRRAEERELFKFAGLSIAIQLDRVDELQDGSTLLIDYKTGDANKIGDWLDVAYPGRPRSPQLPLYALAHREKLSGISFAVLAPGTAEFRGLANNASIAVGIRDYASCKPNTKPASVETWDDLLVHWEAILRLLGKDFLAGEAWVDPLRDECNYCHLASLCRVTELSGVRSDVAEEGADD